MFLVPSPPGISPGQRFRFEHYLPLLEEKGIPYTIRPFLSLWGRKKLYRKGGVLRKILAMAGGYRRRFLDLFLLRKYEYVYIHRWATTAGPPVFEWIIAKLFRKKIIYDFDDAIWVKESPYNQRYMAFKFLGKVSQICRWSYKVSVGNAFLQAFASRYNTQVEVLPTVVNTDQAHHIIQQQDVLRPAVGWTGSFSTLQYLVPLVPVLQRLQEKMDFTFYVIADQDPHLPLKNYRFIRWNSTTEVASLLHFHIGLMPLTDSETAKGKCGFKAIQYMALGMPALVSPVGVNSTIVDDGLNGFICNTEIEWETRLESLLKDKELRTKIGAQARRKIVEHYSIQSQQDIFFQLFQ